MHSVGYFSSYDRGLPCLLDMWPKIHAQVPDATLSIYYGWDMFDKVHSKNPSQMKWKWQVIRQLHDLKEMGVKELGRLNHEELAKAMKEIKVWAYPTEFTETCCITALKAQEASCYPVTTGVGALSETIQGTSTTIRHNDGKPCTDIYTSEECQTKFANAVVFALLNNLEGIGIPNVDWSDVAKEWEANLA